MTVMDLPLTSSGARDALVVSRSAVADARVRFAVDLSVDQMVAALVTEEYQLTSLGTRSKVREAVAMSLLYGSFREIEQTASELAMTLDAGTDLEAVMRISLLRVKVAEAYDRY